MVKKALSMLIIFTQNSEYENIYPLFLQEGIKKAGNSFILKKTNLIEK